MAVLKASVVKLFLYLCSLLSLSAGRALGRGVVRCFWLFPSRSRFVTERNIELAFPQLSSAEQAGLARRSLCATGELTAEMGHVWLRSWEHVQGLILKVEGDHLIHEAQASGRGVVVLAPHIGNWEVLGLHLPAMGSTVSLYEPPHLSALGPLIERSRQRSGATLVPTDSRGLVRLLKSVKGGGISGILPDQVPRDINSGINVPFMGIPCFTGTLAANMIRRTGALAVFGMARRVPGGFHIHYELAEDGIYDENMIVSLTALNRGVEALVRQCPEQYQWEYKRFKVRPRVGADLYSVK